MTKKKKHYLTKNEFIFNFISIIAVLAVAIYFGGRSFYYYGMQNVSSSTKTLILNNVVLKDNQLATTKDGLYRDDDGYYFKGNITNNYLLAFNRLFRILRVEDDGTVKLVTEDNTASFMWGNNYKYHKSNIYPWLTKTDDTYSGVYYNTIPNIKDYLVKTSYSEDILSKKVTKSKKTSSDYVTTLGINDYINSGASKGFINNKKIFYLMGTNKNKSNLYVDEDGTVEETDGLDGYGVKAVITLKKNTPIEKGTGTLNDPYILKQDSKKNYVDSYIKLGNETWKVYSDTNGILRMYLNGYIMYNGVELTRNYSTTNSLFNINDKNNIAYFLNTTYLNSLPYNSILLPTNFSTGEISNEKGYKYDNIYTSTIQSKVGLLNIFDYVSNNTLNDYFHLNTTSTIGSIEYSTYSNGLLEEDEVNEPKHIVPVISIYSNNIKKGSGTLIDPYQIG